MFLRSASKRHGLNANTLPAQDIQDELAGAVVLVHKGALLGESNIVEVLLKEIRAVHWATLGLGMELGRENRSGLVHHTLVATIVEVHKVLLEVAGQSASINGIAVVLAGDVALASGQVQSGNVVSSVAVLELDGAGTNGESQKLVAKTDSHDGNGRSLHQASEVVDSLLAMSWVTGTVGDEDTVVVLRHLVDGVVVREDGDGGTAADQASKDVLLDTAVNQSNVVRGTRRLDHKGSLGAHTLDQIDLARVDEAFVFVGVVLVTNRNPSKGRTLLSEEGDNLTSINARNGRNTLTSTPGTQALDSSPVAVVESHIGHNNTSTLDVRGLKVLEEAEVVTLVGRHAVVANERLSKDQNLATV